MISPIEIAALWSKYADGLGLLIRARCPSNAEDVVQEAYIRLACQAKLPDDPLAWLARTTRNLAIDFARQDKRRRNREQQFVETQARWFEPEAVLETSAEELTEAMLNLPCDEHEILVAHIWNGMSFRQIAEAFQLSSSTANRRYQQALERLRKLLEKQTFPNRREVVHRPHELPES